MTSPASIRTIKKNRRYWIAALMDEHGKVGLSRLVNINADYLWQMGKASGKSARGCNDENAATIEDALGKPRGWLDRDPMDDGGLAMAVALPETRPDYVRVEQMDAEGIMGKEGRVNDEVPEVIRAVDYTPSYIRSVMGFVPPPGRLVLITGRGNSMLPVIQPGDSILVDMGIKEFDGDGLYLINSGNGEQVKALQDRGGSIYVVSANSELFPAYPASKETRVLGKVYLRNRIDRFN